MCIIESEGKSIWCVYRKHRNEWLANLWMCQTMYWLRVLQCDPDRTFMPGSFFYSVTEVIKSKLAVA